MSSLTIEELKKALKEKGVTLPSSKARKDDYVKLYEEHIAPGASLADTYSSDEESSQSSKKVTSSNDIANTLEGVSALSSEELFDKLKEYGFDAGPVLPNTRKVYEKKLIRLMQGERNGTFSNGVGDKIQVDSNEISDNEDVSEISKKFITNEKTTRGSPKPNGPLPSFLNDFSAFRESALPKSTRISYIEKIPRGSSRRIIDTESDGDLRQRHTSVEDSDYIGRWSPKLSRFTTTGVKTQEKGYKKKVFTLIAALVIGAALLAFGYYQWTSNDLYQQIQDETAKEMMKHSARKAEN